MRPKRSATTIQDVARAAGVSVTTVSRVLNNKDDVAPETYDSVRRVIEELNYTASLAAKGMRSRKTNVLGLVVPDVVETFHIEVIKGIGRAIRDFGYDLIIYTSGTRPLSSRASWEQEHVALLSGGLTEGNIVVTPSAPAFPDASRIVVIDPQGDGTNVPSVIARNRVGAMAAMEYLIGLGHCRIGFIGGRPDALSAARRFAGYQDGLAAAGIPFDPDLVQGGDYTQERGRAAARELLDRPNRPTAIFAANDKTALGVMDVAQELGLRIPQDLSLVGFDNLPEAAQVHPQLTTVDQSIQEMGYLATKMLVSMLQGEELGSPLCKVPTRLIIRESCQAVGSHE
ncbi:MAG TPA: LacI family DNA-binding transcriptional regulator [Roseiflexaceae bacterium]